MVLKSEGRSPFLFAYGTFTPYGGPFQGPSAKVGICNSMVSLRVRPPLVLQPLRSIKARSPFVSSQVWAVPLSLTTTQGIISFPRGTEMFQFPRLPPRLLGALRYYSEQVSPFGNPRLRLLDGSPRLFAVLLRPSSAPNAKASAVRPFAFNLHPAEDKTIFYC